MGVHDHRHTALQPFQKVRHRELELMRVQKFHRLLPDNFRRAWFQATIVGAKPRFFRTAPRGT